MKITLIAGARPNFIKISPVIDAIEKAQSEGHHIFYRLVHTGQHYDKSLSNTFFEQLGIQEPHVNLEVGSGTHARQAANIMIRFEEELIQFPPDVVLVVGDVNSTVACTIVAKKMNIDVVHVEAGIRSFDRTMPEEINRILTDSICDHFFTTSEFANNNLLKEGIDSERIHFVGNTMIDTLLKNIDRLIKSPIWYSQGLKEKQYFILTLHRPNNVDDPQQLKELLETILQSTQDMPVIFPVHPRTRKMLHNICLSVEDERLILFEPMGYLEFIYLVKNSFAVITDSGGIQEETTVLQVPCVTLRNTTERPETVTMGTNALIGTNASAIPSTLDSLFKGNWKKGQIPALWDGKSAERIVSKLINIYGSAIPQILQSKQQ